MSEAWGKATDEYWRVARENHPEYPVSTLAEAARSDIEVSYGGDRMPLPEVVRLIGERADQFVELCRLAEGNDAPTMREVPSVVRRDLQLPLSDGEEAIAA